MPEDCLECLEGNPLNLSDYDYSSYSEISAPDAALDKAEMRLASRSEENVAHATALSFMEDDRVALDHLDNDLQAEDFEQVERDMRAAGKPLAVESPLTQRWHKILVVFYPLPHLWWSVRSKWHLNFSYFTSVILSDLQVDVSGLISMCIASSRGSVPVMWRTAPLLISLPFQWRSNLFSFLSTTNPRAFLVICFGSALWDLLSADVCICPQLLFHWIACPRIWVNLWLQIGGKGTGKSTFIKCVSAAFQDLRLRTDLENMTAEGVLENANQCCKHNFSIEVSTPPRLCHKLLLVLGVHRLFLAELEVGASLL